MLNDWRNELRRALKRGGHNFDRVAELLGAST